jgi:hypothetical protein
MTIPNSYCSQLTVCTSAYPIHYKSALAFYTILSDRTLKVCQTPLAATNETGSAMLPRSYQMAFMSLDFVFTPSWCLTTETGYTTKGLSYISSQLTEVLSRYPLLYITNVLCTSTIPRVIIRMILDTTLGDRPPSCTFTPRFISWLTFRPMGVLVQTTGVWENGSFHVFHI